MNAGGRTWLWDSEQFARDVPVGFDELHYCVNAVTHEDGFASESILSGLNEAPGPRQTTGGPTGARCVPGNHVRQVRRRIPAAGRRGSRPRGDCSDGCPLDDAGTPA